MTRFFLMAAVALGLVACNKDEAPKSGNNGDGDVWASFTIALPSTSGFRAESNNINDANAKDTYVGTDDEQKVNNVRIVLYEGDIAAYSFDYTVPGSNYPGGDIVSGTKTKFVTKAKKVVKKEYKALVLINANAEILSATSKGNNLAEFDKVVETTPEKMMEVGFFMSNSQGFVPVTTDRLKDKEADAESAPIAVKVDRAVAKVFVGGIPAPSVDGAAKFEDVKWTLDVTNKKTFWVRKLANRVNGKNVFEAEVLNDNSDRYDRYAKDPNFTGHANLMRDNFNYLNTENAIQKLKVTGFNDSDGQYVLENTMEAADQYNSVTTRVILSLIYIPKDIEDNKAKTYGWYSYKGFKMDQDKFNALKDQALELVMPAELPGTPIGFAQDMHNLSKENDAAIKVEKGVKVDHKKSFTKHNLKFYSKGVNYYNNIYIRHFSDEQSSTRLGYGRYGIVRNNIYKLTLGKISQPGEPEVVEPDPKIPDDLDEQWVSFDVEVLPWIVRTQTIDL